MTMLHKIAVACALLGAAGAASAQSIEVKVTGAIVPAACTPTLTGGGVIDYGNIPATTLKAAETNLLPLKTVDFSVSCDKAIKVGFKTVSNRLEVAPGIEATANTIGSNAVPQMFGLGMDSAGAPIGAWVARFNPTSATVDAAANDLLVSADAGKTWGSDDNGRWVGAVGNAQVHTFGAKATLAPAAGQVFAAKIDVEAMIDQASKLDTSKRIPLDGSATLEMVYI
jgi:type 1 fimbria pilin